MAETLPPNTPTPESPGSSKLSFYSPDEVIPLAEFSPPHYAFTPKPSYKNIKLPKAWERRPATPFKPRGTGKNQKIWKRVFQDENAIDTVLCSIRKRKQDPDRKVVKKLKLQDADGNQASSSIGTRWDGNVDADGRKGKKMQNQLRKRVGLVSNRQGAFGKNKASLKRRSVRLSIQKDGAANASIFSQMSHEEGCSSEVLAEVIEGQGHITMETLPTMSESIKESEESAPANAGEMASQSPQVPWTQQSVDPAISGTETVNTTGSVERSPQSDADSAPSSHVTLSTTSDQSESTESLDSVTVPTTSKVTSPNTAPATELAALTQNNDADEDSNDTEVMSDADMDAYRFDNSKKHTMPISLEEHSSGTGSETEIESFESVEDGVEQNAELEARSSLGDGILCPTTSPSKDSTEPPDIDQIVTLPSILTQSFIEPSTEDDTEFLQGFLSRAKAKKQAKAAIVPNQLEDSSIYSSTRTRSQKSLSKDAQSEFSAIARSESKKDQANENEKPGMALTGEIKPTSPRRSSRSRVVRPSSRIAPAVPNTIPVRRSNGTEFVFLQKDEVQKLALTTRRNTQRNKGEAVHPTCRLLELKNPPQEAERSERSRRSRSGSQSPRKRTKKTDKQVQWDNQLAYFQERQRASESESSSRSGTKKVRRLGTPAAKRRIEKIALEEEGTFGTSSTLGPSEVRLRLRGDQ